MEYELAKQLKDAGFPFKECNLNEYGGCENRHCLQILSDFNYCDPTLSELIEACGDRFQALHRLNGAFEACGGCYEGMDFECAWEYQINDLTPEEAVAKLWLELNKK